jgi:hypothetical protein
VSATIPALIVTLVGALVSTANLVGPPSLPPEQVAPPPDDAQPEPPPDGSADPPSDGAPEGAPDDPNDDPNARGRTALPPGLQPVPFPLEHQRRAPPPTGDDPNAAPPAQERRSIVDLRDPFNRPPPRPRSDGHHDPTVRLLMPDLKDPFAPGVRPVRSKTLDMHVPNDIRDPFRSPPPSADRPACAKTTRDGVVVQAPGKRKVPDGECQPSQLDLRDPFDRER